MLVGLYTVAIASIIADLAGNSTTRRYSRTVFGVAVLVEVGAFRAMGGIANWVVSGITIL